ncbi:MAG: DegV family protein [Anaerolineales bacterium]
MALICAQGAGTVVLAPVLLHAGGAPTVGVVGLLLFTLAAWAYSRLPDRIGRLLDNVQGARRGVAWEELRAGWRFIVGKPVVRSSIAYLVLMSGVILVIMTLVPGLVSRAWDFPIEQMPLLAVPGGLGFGLGVVLLGRLGSRFEEEDWLRAGLFTLGVGLAVIPLIRALSGISLLLFLLIAVCSGAGAAMVVIPARTLVQERTPDPMRGRVISTQLFLSNALSMAPLPILGGLADLFGVQRMFTFLGLFLVITAVLSRRGFKRGLAAVGQPSLQTISTAEPLLELAISPSSNVAVERKRTSSDDKNDRTRVGKIAIVTDSASNLPSEVVDEYGITVVPVSLLWDEHVFRDGIDIDPDEVYQRLRSSKSTPTTAAPSVGDFLQTYLQLGEGVDAIVSIHLPDRLSGVISAARLAAGLVEDQVQVYVVDAGTAAMGAGFVALAAARAASKGLGVDSIQRVAQDIRKRVFVFAMLDTLKYLQRGGRIGKAEALLGVALKIKPILFINDGVVDVLAKPRTTNRAIRIMLNEMEKRVASRPVHVAVLHADAPESAADLRKRVEERFDCVEVFTCAFTPVMGVHAGPGVIGLAFYAEEE